MCHLLLPHLRQVGVWLLVARLSLVEEFALAQASLQLHDPRILELVLAEETAYALVSRQIQDARLYVSVLTPMVYSVIHRDSKRPLVGCDLVSI
jgi:hypothetical protein